MIAVQEELDWETYRLYGLIDEDLTYSGETCPVWRLESGRSRSRWLAPVQAGEEETAWFHPARSTPITEIPAHWPTAYRDLVQRRLDAHCGEPVDPVAGEAGVQAAVGAGAVGEAAGAGAAGLAAGPTGGSAVLV